MDKKTVKELIAQLKAERASLRVISVYTGRDIHREADLESKIAGLETYLREIQRV